MRAINQLHRTPLGKRLALVIDHSPHMESTAYWLWSLRSFFLTLKPKVKLSVERFFSVNVESTTGTISTQYVVDALSSNSFKSQLVLLRWQEYATRSVAVFFDMLPRWWCRWRWRIEYRSVSRLGLLIGNRWMSWLVVLECANCSLHATVEGALSEKYSA